MTRVIAIFCALIFAIPAFAESDEAQVRAQIKRLGVGDQETLSKAKYAGHYSLSNLVTYSNHQGRLVATFHLPADLVKQFADPAPLIISVEASQHVWTVSRSKSGTLDEGLSLITLTCYAPDEIVPFNRYSLASDGDRVMVSGSQMFGHPATQQSLLMNQGERGMHLAWRLAAERFAPKSMNVTELSEIQTRVPNLQQQFLMPIFRRLGPGRPASDVYRVFDQIPANPMTTKQIMPLLMKLDADDSTVRDAAAIALKKAGAPAILSCMRMDRSLLTPEQNGRIDAFCSTDGWVHLTDIEAARHDGDFLKSCLEDEDPAVRTAAANQLAALRTAGVLR